jgi:spore coat protein H
MLLALLLACTSTPTAPPITGDPCGPAFERDEVPELHLTLSEDVIDALYTDFTDWEERHRAGEDVKPYHPVERLDYQCQTVHDAMIRLKGNPCCSWDVGEKLQYTIAFNQVDRGGRFQKLRKIALDAPHYDPSLLRERTAYSAFEDMGQAASQVNHVRLVINGLYEGVYANVEVLDKEWLQRRLERDDAEGTLWKLDYLAARMEPRTNGTFADQTRWSALMAAETLDELAPLMDIEHSIESIAAETIVNQSDGYWVGGVNFYVYDHPRHGFQVLPWDLDNTWDRWPPHVAPTTRSGSFYPTDSFNIVLDDPALRQTYIDEVRRRHARVDPDELVRRVDDWAALIRPAMEEDPSRHYSMAEHEAGVSALKRSIRDRHAWLADWLETAE